MAIVYEPGHINCRCRILESGEWVFAGEPGDKTEKGNDSPCELCQRLGNAHNRRLGFMDVEMAKNITFSQIKIIKSIDECNCSKPDNNTPN